MDRKFISFMIVTILIFVAYPHYLKWINPEGNVISGNSESVASQSMQETVKKMEVIENKEVVNVNSVKEEVYRLETESLIIYVSNIGAQIKKIELKDSKTPLNEDVVLFNASESDIKSGLGFASHILFEDNRRLEGSDVLAFNVMSEKKGSIVLEGVYNGLKLRKKITANNDNEMFYAEIEVINQSASGRNISAEVSAGFYHKEEQKFETRFVSSVVKSFNEYKSAAIGKIKKKGFVFNEKVDWVALQDKYFTVIAQSEEGIGSRVVNVSDYILMSYIKYATEILSQNDAYKIRQSYFCGPKEFALLKSQNNDFEYIISRGFWGSIRVGLLKLLNWLYILFDNYGIAIIVLTFLIKLAFAPLTHKSFESMKRMQELQPKMKALQEKHKEDPQKLNKEMMELYRKHKANPFGGCLPMLLQIPVFIALYQTLSQSVELRGAPFVLWITDLSQPDRLFTLPFSLPLIGDAINLLPIIMMFAMIIQQKMTPNAASKEQANMMVLMPIVFVFIFYNFPAGLVLYWLVNNVVTIVHQGLHKKYA